jgi:tetratricopeptide (TPR) repeat protein
MYRHTLLLTALLGTNIVLAQNSVSAKSAVEVSRIATAITTEIKVVGTEKVGSGILLQRQGDVYTVLTAAHVVPKGASVEIKTADGTVHKSLANSLRNGGNVDLAVVKFRSSKNYTIPKIGTSNSLEIGSSMYVAGFPESTYAIEAGTLNVTEGRIIGKAAKGNSKGYSLIYSNTTMPGMSGGPVLNEAGELVAIHGQGDRTGKEGEGEKTGRNLGITVERFGSVSLVMGLQLDQQVLALPGFKALNASDYLLAGNEKVDLKDYVGAVSDYKQAIFLNPKLSEAYANLGLVKFIQYDLAGAVLDYNQSIILNPKLAIAYANRGGIKAKQRDLNGAVLDINQAIMLDSKLSVAYAGRGLVKQYQHDLTGAILDYNQAIVLNPKLAVAYANRGGVKIKQNDLTGAISDINQAIMLDSKLSVAYVSRGYLKFKQNDLTGAISDFDQALALDPKSPEAYNDRSAVKIRQNDLTGAISDINQAILLDPKLPESYANRGVVKLVQNDLTGAMSDINQAISLDPKLPESYINRGLVKGKMKDLTGAVLDLNQALTLNPKLSEAYLTRSAIKVLQNDFKGATLDISQAIALNPKLPESYYVRGELYLRQNNLKGAISDFNQVIVLNPKMASIYGKRGITKFQNLNDVAGGIADLNKMIEIEPNDADGYYNRGDIFYLIGKKANALADFRKAAMLGKTSDTGLIAKGIINLEAGSIKQAIDSFNQAEKVKQLDDGADLYKYRGLAYRKQGNTNAAINDWKKAAQIYKKENQQYSYRIVRSWLQKLGIK